MKMDVSGTILYFRLSRDLQLQPLRYHYHYHYHYHHHHITFRLQQAFTGIRMSEYENVVPGKLRLKGRPLDVKPVGITKKKKHKKHYEQIFAENNPSGIMEEMNTEKNAHGGYELPTDYDERLTPAERRYLEQWKQLEARRLLKNAKDSHRERIQKFNHYLANLSEHYDIPKVGPG